MANRCEADKERMERAAADDTIVHDMGNGMKRMVTFQVGYDHTKFPVDCGGGGHGRHGMTIRFILVGPHGAVQWVVNLPNWFPGNVDILDNVDGSTAVSAVTADPWARWRSDGMPTDLGYHAKVPQYNDQTKMECHLLPEGECYYDGSSLNAGPVLKAFLEHGPHAVWASLAAYYQVALIGERRTENGLSM